MKSEFLIATTQICAEKNLPKEVVIAVIEFALISAYKRTFDGNQNISVKILPHSGEIKVYAQKKVVHQVTDAQNEISLEEAGNIKAGVRVEDMVDVEVTPTNFGRIAAQTAKQVVLQRLKEAEREAVFDEFVNKEGDIVHGLVQRIEPKQIIIDLGKTEAILPASEQIPSERYRIGQRVKAYLLEVQRTFRAPILIVSRTHPHLVRRLFELEVPEIYNGIVEIKAIAREPGFRSKVAVVARQEGIDPIGCCVGMRGVRIQAIVNGLGGGEKIDVVEWHEDPRFFVANALSPAQVLNVEVEGKERLATVVVPDRQLSLAIGRDGQNARLAAWLTGWKIDIKSASAAKAEEEKVAQLAAEAKEKEKVSVIAEVLEELPAPSTPEEIIQKEPLVELVIVTEEVPPLTTEAEGAEEELLPLANLKIPLLEHTEVGERPQIRFAEDIFLPGSERPDERKKKGKRVSEEGETKKGVKAPKRRLKPLAKDEENYDEYDLEHIGV